jgi:hypothetical protein
MNRKVKLLRGFDTAVACQFLDHMYRKGLRPVRDAGPSQVMDGVPPDTRPLHQYPFSFISAPELISKSRITPPQTDCAALCTPSNRIWDSEQR